MARSEKPQEKTTKKGSKKKQTGTAETKNENLWRLFWRGFFTPVRWIGRSLSWLIHHPPFSTIGHGLKWFFMRRPVRFVGRILGLRYVRDSWYELRSVTWPARKESFRLTGAVILFALVFGLFIAVVDFGLDKLFKQILLN